MPIFAPKVGIGYYSPGIMERIRYSALEDWWRERDQAWDRSSLSTFPAPSSQSSWPYQPFTPGTCYLEIKLFFTSTSLAK